MRGPDFSFEETIWEKNIYVIGIDEVGRGALAGPVVAAAARVKNTAYRAVIEKLGIDDSKRLTYKKRKALIPYIKKYFHTAIGEAEIMEINNLGIVRATGLAMRRAVNQIKKDTRDYFILVDGFPVKFLPGGLKRQLAIIDGDRKSVSIAAASIVAKVYRDKLMIRLARQTPRYKWGRNKGYGTLFHRLAIKNHGICQQHRLLFVDSLI